MKDSTIGGVRLRVLKWKDVDRLVDKLASTIKDSYRPSVIVGIHRGGSVVAHLLTDRLAISRFYTIGCESYRSIGEAGELVIYQPLTVKSLRGDDVLLVDDVCDSGKTLKGLVERELRPKKPRQTRTAVLHIKPRSEFMPDYYVEKVAAWVVYPWELYETANALLKKVESKDRRSELRNVVVKELGVSKKYLKFLKA